MFIIIWLLTLVVPQDQPLDEVIKKSSTVVVARRGNVAARTIEIPIKGAKAPFKRVQEPMLVREVLKGDTKLKGQTIYIDVFDWGFNRMMSEQIAAGNRNLPSKAVPRYKAMAKKPPSPKEEQILFLRAEDDGAYEPIMMDAVESVQFLKQVKAACEPPPATPPATP